MTQKQAIERVKALGGTLRREAWCDEYIVKFKEATYHTTDIEDAVGTAKKMAEDLNKLAHITSESIGEAVKAYAAKHPKMNISFGYIGNLSPSLDDRSWRIFYNLPDHQFALSMGGYETWDLTDMLSDLETLFGSLERIAVRYGM